MSRLHRLTPACTAVTCYMAWKVSKIQPKSGVPSVLPVCDQQVAGLHSQRVDRNLSLMVHGTSDADNFGKIQPRPLAVILAWLYAKEQHIEKYRLIYSDRGFDTLTVRISPMELLRPQKGTQVVARNLLDFLNAHNYEKVVVHAFSVGAYQFSESLILMHEQGEKYARLLNRFAGVIYDSAVDYFGTSVGVARAATANPLLQKAIQGLIDSYMYLFYNVSTKHYIKASQMFHNTILRCPALLFVSHRDKIGNKESNERAANTWRSKGIEVKYKCWNKSPHVGHLRFYPEEYIYEVDRFLTRINLGKNQPIFSADDEPEVQKQSHQVNFDAYGLDFFFRGLRLCYF